MGTEIIIGKRSADEQLGVLGQRLRVSAVGQGNSFEFYGTVVCVVSTQYAHTVELDDLYAVDELPNDEDVRVMHVLTAEASWTVLCPVCKTEQPIPCGYNPDEVHSFQCSHRDCTVTLIVCGATLKSWARREEVRVGHRFY